MITFKYRSNSKRINIRTSKRLDERMSGWLQKVFNIKNQIIGFKSSNNKYYDVNAFYQLIDQFYNSQVEIVEGNDQVEISFTSDNLNSSSFIWPSQPNTSEINPKAGSSDEDEVAIVSDRSTFQKKLVEGRDVSILFDINIGFKKEIIDSIGDFNRPYSGSKVSISILLNNSSPKKSNYTIYIGKTNIVTIPLTTEYKLVIQNTINRAKTHTGTEQNKAVRRHEQIEDQAPSFTTYHLQERLNYEACLDYLGRMNREKVLSNYQYHKLVERLEDNFNQFYRIFCEGIMDNDYESFKNEVRLKVENNLEMLLSNVEEMDLSRPISREEQRRQNFKKSMPDIEIVKVQNYFQVLDLIKDKIDPKYLGQIKQNLLDENQELCTYFSKFLSRDFGKEELSKKLTAFSRARFEDLRPFSRCVPRINNRAKSTEHVRKQETGDEFLEMKAEPKLQEPPMFGTLSIPQYDHVSPIKNMSDIESNYKWAEERLEKKTDYFASEEYGLLYYYLQTRDDSISNLVQEMQEDEEGTLNRLRVFLKERLEQILSQAFNQSEISYIQAIKRNQTASYIFDNFKYDSDVPAFILALREEIVKGKPQIQRILHKKSSDSQLLDNKNGREPAKRKYSGSKKVQQQENSPSPKASDISYQKGSQFSLYNLSSMASPWKDDFQEMLRFCNFQQKQKQQYLRLSYQQYNPSLFLWVRQFIKNKQTQEHDSEYFRQHIQKKEYDQRGIIKIVPLFSELMRQLQQQGKITYKMRKWAVFNFMQLSLPLIAAFQLYLLQKDQEQLIESVKITFEQENQDMEYYKMYVSRIEVLLKQMAVHNETSMEIFRYYPKVIKSIIEVYYFTGDFEELMDSLDVLESKHVQRSTINIATLNFSGINTNPFEYDDGSELFQKINQHVKMILQKQAPGMKEWKVGKIDKNYTQKGRLSVGFSSSIDMVDNCLLSKSEFEAIWQEKFNGSEVKSTFAPSSEEIATSIQMDYTFYRAILLYVYQLKTLEELDQNLKTLNPELFNQFLAQKFNRPASQIDVKANLVNQYLKKEAIDVLCLQEAGFVDWGKQLAQGYRHLKHHDSIIIYNTEKVGNIRTDLMERHGKQLDFNSDTAFLFTDRHFLLISAHLKSNNLHIEQAKQMFITLRKIKEEHPLLKIAIGMDANHLVNHENLLDSQSKQVFYLTPSEPTKPTTVKKRSFLQAQFKKSGLAVSEVKDHIVASRNISQATIQRIDGHQSLDELLPNDIHPYDHYLVRAVIKFL